MYNLIVNAGGWPDGRNEFLESRIFEATSDELGAQFRTAQGIDFNKLMTLPTLFMQEGQDAEVARLGTILSVRPAGRNILMTYTYDQGFPGIQNRQLIAIRADLEIGEGGFTRTHWSVKDVDLCRVLLTHGVQRRVGPRVFRIDEHEAIENDLVSVMMPFNAAYRPVYEALQVLCRGLGLRCERADDIWENDVVMQDVVSLIDRSRVVIADCTSRNPNVFYEIGIAHTLGRNVLLITQVAADVPFDLQHIRFAQYLNNREGLEAMAVALRRKLQDLG